jgi:hypothetical protein
MKLLRALILLVTVYSCADADRKPPSRPPLVMKDSSMLKNEPANPYVTVDVSPMDMSYLPEDYPVAHMSGKTTGPPIARIIYSRPHKQGRKIFGQLLKYGEPWRLGANEATELELFQPITIQGKMVGKGKYILYGILHAEKWTIVFNNNLFTWGLNQDTSKDLFRFDVPVAKKQQSVEYYSMVFQKTADGADLVMAWDDVEVRLPIQFTE